MTTPADGATASKKMSPFLFPLVFLFGIVCLMFAATLAYPERRAISWLTDYLWETVTHFAIVALVALWITSKIKKNNEGGGGGGGGGGAH